MSDAQETHRREPGAGSASSGAPDLTLEERFALVTQAIGEGLYDWGIGSNTLWVSPRLNEIVAPPGPSLTPGDWTTLVHPDDFAAYRAALRGCFKGTTARLECEYRVRHGDGTYRWIEDRAVPVRDTEGRVLRLVGAVTDISQRKATEQALCEALEQQTATAEVLQVINSSPGDLAPVFDAMLEKAMRLCEAKFGTLWLYDGEYVHAAANRGSPPAYIEFLGRGPHRPSRNAQRRLLAGERVVQIADVTATEAYRSGDELARAVADLGGIRTLLAVPLRKDAGVLGNFGIYREEVRPFSDKQIALLENFAAQAVIAMENARLITETREALEQQTATAEVLQVINASPGDLAPVFDAILEKAHTLCGAPRGALFLNDGAVFQAVATRGLPEAFADRLRQGQSGPDTPTSGPLLAGERFVHILDLAELDDPIARGGAQIGNRTLLSVPLRKGDAVLGMIVAARPEVRAFTDKQIALLQNFAAQAVIAMENARLITETREALDQQTATAEVLGVINSSPGDLAPVFNTMLEKAVRLCDAVQGVLWTLDGERIRLAGSYQVAGEFVEVLRRIERGESDPPEQLRQIMRGEKIVRVEDVAGHELYRTGHPVWRAAVESGRVRSLVWVALVKDNLPVGAFAIARREVRPFSDKQIALLQNFAAQAVIAMENARLLNELRERTADLQESLEYQTATSDVLRVISQSTFDLTPVLETVVVTAIRLCRADHGGIYLNEGGEYRRLVGHGLPEEYDEVERNVRIRPGPGTLVGRAAFDRRTVHIPDALTDPLYEAKDDARVGGAHTMLGVPLLREGTPIGVIGLARQRVEPYTEKEIALVNTFADQAVIAIENARLLNELRDRTADLQESLEYQTATSDVLKVISQSGAELGSVLDTLVETATGICDGVNAIIFRFQNGLLHFAASYGITPEYREFLVNHPHPISRGTLVGRTASEQRVVQIADVTADPEYAFAESQQRGQLRTMLGVPLMREGALVGVLALARHWVQGFTEKQIELVRTFADQAVIAIENARLLNELRDSTDELAHSVEELKALSEVGQAVSSTLDLRGVLSTILDRSVALAEADAGAIYRYRRADRTFRFVEAVGYSDAMVSDVRALDVGEHVTGMGIAIANRAPVQIPDLRERPPNPLRDQAIAAGYRSVLIVPLVGADRILGATILQRRAIGEFPEATVRLMQTLASQSVLAIQNARLFREIAEKSEQLAEASRHKSQFLANMSHELRTPLNAILGYTELMADGIYGEMAPRAAGVLERVQNNGKHLLALINDVLDLAKIEAGQLVLTLEDYALPDVVQSVVSATEGLANAKGLGFTAEIAAGLPIGHGDARRLSQVLLNLVGNAVKFTDAGEVAIRAAAESGSFVLTVRDTGPGIAPENHDKIFGEFQQIDNSNTRKKGGTGLGLAISKRMVEMQGGTISVESELGKGATFRVILPIRVAGLPEELMGAAQ